MKVLVTGGAGMIGSNLCRRLLEEGHEVVVVDNLWRGSLENLSLCCGELYPNITFHNADLSYYGDWVAYFKDIDCVYHLADIVAGIGYVFSNENTVFRKNLQINCNVASACELFNVGRYVYVGTACSFPLHLQTGVNAAPLKETDQYPAHPESAYGWSKLMGELDAGYMAKYANIDTVTLVFHNVYGIPCEYNSVRSQVLPALAYKGLRALETGKLVVWGDGEQGRAFVHIDDIVEALFTALTKGHGAGPIQIGPDICTSISAAAKVITGYLGGNIEIVYDTSKPKGDLGRSADFSKAQTVLGWSPEVDFRDGVTEMLNWIAEKEGIRF